MKPAANDLLVSTLGQDVEALLADWVRRQLGATGKRPDLIGESALRDQSRQFLLALQRGIRAGGERDITAPQWSDAREFLEQLSRSRAQQGFTPRETAMFIFSLKEPLFAAARTGPDASLEQVWDLTLLLDQFGLYTTEMAQRSREEIIARQQRELLELSTPVVRLWDDILALPLVGTLDSARTQVVMETLLQKVVDTGSSIAIIDITGVPTVDTLVAQHLLKTVAATRLMGADCIISGIRPQIAQTIVHLGVDLGEVTTKATLADAFAVALQRTGATIGPRSAN